MEWSLCRSYLRGSEMIAPNENDTDARATPGGIVFMPPHRNLQLDPARGAESDWAWRRGDLTDVGARLETGPGGF